MSERENGWYLRSDGYMTSEYSYQRIDAMKGNRALDNHQRLVFVKFMGGEEKDSRVYVPHPGTCEWLYPQGVAGWLGYAECSNCGYMVYENTIDEREWTYCPNCGARIRKAVER